jgi:hypothetical protein
MGTRFNLDAEMKKAEVAPILLLAFLIIAIAGTFFVRLGVANPYIRDWKMEEIIPVPEGTKLPVVTISSPQNNTFYASRNFLLNFSVTTEMSNNISLRAGELYYTASWRTGRTDIDMQPFYVKNNYSYPSAFSIKIIDVPEGPRWLKVFAVATAFAYETRHDISGIYYTTYYSGYKTISSSTAEFTIDTTIPKILSLSMENKTYDTSNVPFILTTNEPVSQVSYSLDEQVNVTVAGNTTLTDLPNGVHNITVYALDNAGNVAPSKTVFTVTKSESLESYPIVPLAAMASVALLGAGLLVFFKKRKRDGE